MKTKIVYVLTSTPLDHYLEELFTSLQSLRYYNPDAYVELLTDTDTASTLIGLRKQMVSDVSKINVITAPKGFSKMQISRYIKTNVRQFIQGDYVMLDLDTIITDKLDGLDDIDCQIGAVLDYYGKTYSNAHLEWDRKNVETMGWPEVISTPRYNSGVFLVKDTPETHKFYTKWHTYWLECKEKGINIDQLSLRKTLLEMPIITTIASEWHIQPNVMYGGISDELMMQSRIIHCFDVTFIPYIRTAEIFRYIKKHAALPPETEHVIKGHAKVGCAWAMLNKGTYEISVHKKTLYEFWRDDFSIFYCLDKFLTNVRRWRLKILRRE